MGLITVKARIGPGRIRFYRYRGTIHIAVDGRFLTVDGYHIYTIDEVTQDVHVFDKFWLEDVVSIVGE